MFNINTYFGEKTIQDQSLNVKRKLETNHHLNEEVDNKIKKIIRYDFVDEIDGYEELKIKIFSYLNIKECGRCCLVSKKWGIIASKSVLANESYPQILEKAFGKKQWKEYFGGDVDLEPVLPIRLFQILKSPCPLSPEKKIEETHQLVLIPATVNGKHFNLNALQELLRNSKKEYIPKFQHFEEIVRQQYSDQTVTRSHWVLITKDIIPESKNKSYQDQRQLIADLAAKTQLNYTVPRLLDIVTCIFMTYVSSGVRLFDRLPNKPELGFIASHKPNSFAYSRCVELTEEGEVVVGGFSERGLSIITANYNDETSIAAQLVFQSPMEV